MPLVAAKDFEDLPTDPINRWLQLRDLVEERLENAEGSRDGLSDFDLLEYHHVLSTAAHNLQVGHFDEIYSVNIREEFDEFRAKVAALATSLSLKRLGPLTSKNSLPLSHPVQVQLREQVASLRALIDSPSLKRSKQTKLNALLDEFELEIEKERLDLSKAMHVIALCAAGIGGTTSFLATAPEAAATLANIAQVIGLQREANEEKGEAVQLPAEPAVPQLPPPPKQIPKLDE